MYLSDILVSDSTDLLDIGSGLGNILKRVTGENKFILHVDASLHGDTLEHLYAANNFFSQEVTVNGQ